MPSHASSIPSRRASTTWFNRSCMHIPARLKGPGGLYNTGNIIGLATGLALQTRSSPEGSSIVDSAVAFFVGSTSGLALTLATLIFLVSGEAYHRAWVNGFPPLQRLNNAGDLLSGFGALALGVSLMIVGQPVLAATAGLLHAIGKFGSAFHITSFSSTLDWPKVFRSLVIASRIPAILAAGIGIFGVIPDIPILLVHGHAMTIIAPVSFLVCYLLWAKADMLLLKA
jgi:hypothetical protein